MERALQRPDFLRLENVGSTEKGLRGPGQRYVDHKLWRYLSAQRPCETTRTRIMFSPHFIDMNTEVQRDMPKDTVKWQRQTGSTSAATCH